MRAAPARSASSTRSARESWRTPDSPGSCRPCRRTCSAATCCSTRCRRGGAATPAPDHTCSRISRRSLIRPLSRSTWATRSTRRAPQCRRTRRSAAPHPRPPRAVGRPGTGRARRRLRRSPTAGSNIAPHVLRTFAIAHGGTYVAMPGGLARTATADPAQPITNRLGAGSKDTWVLTSDAETRTDFWPADSDLPHTPPSRRCPHVRGRALVLARTVRRTRRGDHPADPHDQLASRRVRPGHAWPRARHRSPCSSRP